MKVNYFSDTDTLLLDFSDGKVVETRDLNENVLVELDADGRVVSMTIEHARHQTNVAEFSYQFVEGKVPGPATGTTRQQRRAVP